MCVRLRVCVCQYDFVELLDGSRLIVPEERPQTVPEQGEAVERPVAMHEAGFFHYLDSGVWHLAFYNDGRTAEQVSYKTNILGETLTENIFIILITFLSLSLTLYVYVCFCVFACMW